MTDFSSLLAPKPPARTSTGFENLDEVFGGGLPAGATVILAGEDGVGRTTLALQIAGAFGRVGKPVVFSTSSSHSRVRAHAEKVGTPADSLTICNEIPRKERVTELLEEARRVGAGLLVVDDFQVAGVGHTDWRSAEQTADRLIYGAMEIKLTLLLINYTIRNGDVAGSSRVLHLADVVAYLEQERGGSKHFKVFSTPDKNRFHRTPAGARLVMTERGFVGSSVRV